MKVIDIKRLGCSFYESANSYSGEKTMIISDVIAISDRWKDRINELRQMPYHSDEQTAFKTKFPCWTPAGIFAKGNVRDNSILKYTNLVAIDIDGIDNPDVDMDELKNKLFELPYVIMASKSISGMGVYVLLLLEDGHAHKAHCQYIERLWKQQYGIDIDKKCYNLSRKRFISYDENLLIKDDNDDIAPFKLKYTPKPQPIKPSIVDCSRYKHKESNMDKEFEKKVDIMIKHHFDIGPHWADWMSFGKCFKPFDKGLELFDKISQTMSAYEPKTFMRNWEKVREEFDKNHALAYITFLLNKNCPGWKDDYYQKELFDYQSSNTTTSV